MGRPSWVEVWLEVKESGCCDVAGAGATVAEREEEEAEDERVAVDALLLDAFEIALMTVTVE